MKIVVTLPTEKRTIIHVSEILVMHDDDEDGNPTLCVTSVAAPDLFENYLRITEEKL